MQEINRRLCAAVVGGSGGIGAALTRGIARRHIPLFIHGRNPDKLEKIRAELAADAVAKVFAEDLSPAGSAGDFAERMAEHCKNTTHYFHALGPFLEKPLSETGEADWDETLYFNLKLPALCATRLARLMAERHSRGGSGGVIVLFGGTKTDTVRPFRTNAAYGAAKTGLAVFAKSLAREYSGKGVSVLTVCPGIVDTEYVPEEKRNVWKRMMPEARLTTAADFASFVIDIAFSDRVSLLNGSVLTLDEGMRI